MPSMPRPSDGLAGTNHDPDERGYFGSFGGRWLPEALVGALDEVADTTARPAGTRSFSGNSTTWPPTTRAGRAR